MSSGPSVHGHAVMLPQQHELVAQQADHDDAHQHLQHLAMEEAYHTHMEHHDGHDDHNTHGPFLHDPQETPQPGLHRLTSLSDLSGPLEFHLHAHHHEEGHHQNEHDEIHHGQHHHDEEHHHQHDDGQHLHDEAHEQHQHQLMEEQEQHHGLHADVVHHQDQQHQEQPSHMDDTHSFEHLPIPALPQQHASPVLAAALPPQQQQHEGQHEQQPAAIALPPAIPPATIDLASLVEAQMMEAHMMSQMSAIALAVSSCVLPPLPMNPNALLLPMMGLPMLQTDLMSILMPQWIAAQQQHLLGFSIAQQQQHLALSLLAQLSHSVPSPPQPEVAAPPTRMQIEEVRPPAITATVAPPAVPPPTSLPSLPPQFASMIADANMQALLAEDQNMAAAVRLSEVIVNATKEPAAPGGAAVADAASSGAAAAASASSSSALQNSEAAASSAAASAPAPSSNALSSASLSAPLPPSLLPFPISPIQMPLPLSFHIGDLSQRKRRGRPPTTEEGRKRAQAMENREREKAEAALAVMNTFGERIAKSWVPLALAQQEIYGAPLPPFDMLLPVHGQPLPQTDQAEQAFVLEEDRRMRDIREMINVVARKATEVTDAQVVAAVALQRSVAEMSKGASEAREAAAAASATVTDASAADSAAVPMEESKQEESKQDATMDHSEEKSGPVAASSSSSDSPDESKQQSPHAGSQPSDHSSGEHTMDETADLTASTATSAAAHGSDESKSSHHTPPLASRSLPPTSHDDAQKLSKAIPPPLWASLSLTTIPTSDVAALLQVSAASSASTAVPATNIVDDADAPIRLPPSSSTASGGKRYRAPAVKDTVYRANTAKDTVHSCSACSKSFSDASLLRKHLKIHAPKGFVCTEPECGRSFVENSKLKRHLLVHTQVKDFTCPYPDCGRSFALEYNLKSHEKLHKGEKLFQCELPECRKRFSSSSNLRGHLMTHLKYGINTDGMSLAPKAVSDLEEPVPPQPHQQQPIAARRVMDQEDIIRLVPRAAIEHQEERAQPVIATEVILPSEGGALAAVVPVIGLEQSTHLHLQLLEQQQQQTVAATAAAAAAAAVAASSQLDSERIQEIEKLFSDATVRQQVQVQVQQQLRNQQQQQQHLEAIQSVTLQSVTSHYLAQATAAVAPIQLQSPVLLGNADPLLGAHVVLPSLSSFTHQPPQQQQQQQQQQIPVVATAFTMQQMPAQATVAVEALQHTPLLSSPTRGSNNGSIHQQPSSQKRGRKRTQRPAKSPMESQPRRGHYLEDPHQQQQQQQQQQQMDHGGEENHLPQNLLPDDLPQQDSSGQQGLLPDDPRDQSAQQNLLQDDPQQRRRQEQEDQQQQQQHMQMQFEQADQEMQLHHPGAALTDSPLLSGGSPSLNGLFHHSSPLPGHSTPLQMGAPMLPAAAMTLQLSNPEDRAHHPHMGHHPHDDDGGHHPSTSFDMQPNVPQQPGEFSILASIGGGYSHDDHTAYHHAHDPHSPPHGHHHDDGSDQAMVEDHGVHHEEDLQDLMHDQAAAHHDDHLGMHQQGGEDEQMQINDGLMQLDQPADAS